MRWGKVRGHERIVEELKRAAARGRMPHAFLFGGPEGVGKRLFATTLAQALLCEQHAEAVLEPCGECFSCRQVAAGTHPDVLAIARPEDKHELPIDRIRQLCAELARTPMRGVRRVAIVDDADSLSPEAANAFLKTLEEPPPGAVLFLIGTAPELQLDTIRSRCRVIRFEPLAESDLIAVLTEQHLVEDQKEAARLAKLAEGSVGRAVGLADPDFDQFRRKLIDELARGFDPPGLSRRVEVFVNEASKESAPRRTRATLLIGELARFLRSGLWRSCGLDPPCPDLDDRRAAAKLAERVDPDGFCRLAERCIEAEYHIARKAHVGLSLDALFHELGERMNPRPD